MTKYFIEPEWGPVHARGYGTSMEVTLGPEAIKPTNYGSGTNHNSIPRCMFTLNCKDFTEYTKITGAKRRKKQHLTPTGTNKKGLPKYKSANSNLHSPIGISKQQMYSTSSSAPKITTSRKGLWVAGHLLNDNLGGSGTDSENLAPLTQTANKNHAGYENRIKSALTAADQISRFKNLDFTIGVYYKVEVMDSFGVDQIYRHAPSHFFIEAKVIKRMNGNENISDLTSADISSSGITKNQERVFEKCDFQAEIHNEDFHLLSCSNANCNH